MELNSTNGIISIQQQKVVLLRTMRHNETCQKRKFHWREDAIPYCQKGIYPVRQELGSLRMGYIVMLTTTFCSMPPQKRIIFNGAQQYQRYNFNSATASCFAANHSA
mmetsp:Transcript_30504/g.52057  ORF Transcript_30504/g.52057 Transcript_30504/m.52057 type:complete len:107 (-) Transcript_30504:64-384(-)